MSYRHSKEELSSQTIKLSILFGLLGLATGVLITPKKGADMRSAIRQKLKKSFKSSPGTDKKPADIGDLTEIIDMTANKAINKVDDIKEQLKDKAK